MSLSHPTNRATFNHHHGVPGQRVPGATRQHGDGRHLLRLFLQGHAEADSGHVLEQITFEPGVVVHHLRGRMRNSTLPLVLRSGAGSRPNVPGLRADAASLAEHREMRFGLRVSPDTIRCGPGEAAFPPGDRPLRVFVDARTPRVVRSLRRNGPRPDTVPLRLLPEAARCPAAPPSDTVFDTEVHIAVETKLHDDLRACLGEERPPGPPRVCRLRRSFGPGHHPGGRRDPHAHLRLATIHRGWSLPSHTLRRLIVCNFGGP